MDLTWEYERRNYQRGPYVTLILACTKYSKQVAYPPQQVASSRVSTKKILTRNKILPQ